MRSDAIGLWWEDIPIAKEKGTRADVIRPIPAIPDTGWKPLKELPNLTGAKVLGIDTETKDPELRTNGPGWARKIGEVVGISICTETGYSCYIPIRHTIQTEFNMDIEKVIPWLKDLLARPMPKVGANLVYDIGWLAEEGIQVNGKLYDVLYAQAILFDTAKDYSLNACAKYWLGEQKDEEALYEWAAQAYGGKVGRNQAANIWRCPPSLVGPYAEVDAELPIKILRKQWAELDRNNLLEVFLLECDLIPVWIGMRQRGMRADIEKAHQVKDTLAEKERVAQEELNKVAGFEVECYAAASLSRLFDDQNLLYPRTTKGAPSFTKDFLAASTYPVSKLINTVRKYNKAGGTFVQKAIIEKAVNGRVYPSFHPLRGEDGGAVSGRLSSSNPNAQQYPSRDKELGPAIRGIFIPDDGYTHWIKQDLSQIEYRLFAHYSGDGRLIEAYQDHETDYHEVVSGFLGNLIPRGPIKNFNFMSLYGGGKKKVIKMLKAEFTKKKAEELFFSLANKLPNGDIFSALADLFITLYSENFPAASESLQRDLEIAENYGEIRTILGRRSTFDLWEPMGYRKQKALPRQQALEAYGSRIKRAYCFRALNRRLQGSAADLLKKGMLNAYNEGVFKEIGFSSVTVHDELDSSYHEDLRGGFYRLQRCIETAIPVKIPILLGAEIGPNWGSVKHIDLQK